MADLTTNTILSICVTTSSRVKELTITDGQLIFVRDANKLAFDYGGKRVFYRSITELATEQDRLLLTSPIESQYYFVIGTAVLWTFQGGKWIQLTTPPQEIVFIGEELPELGNENTLYVNKEEKNISYWNNETSSYEIVGERIVELSNDDILSLFKQITIE